MADDMVPSLPSIVYTATRGSRVALSADGRVARRSPLGERGSSPVARKGAAAVVECRRPLGARR